jgi:hypothetical protein
LQQELEKLHDLRNKVKLEGELWDDLVSSSSQNSHLVSKATRLWDSLLARKSKCKILYFSPLCICRVNHVILVSCLKLIRQVWGAN